MKILTIIMVIVVMFAWPFTAPAQEDYQLLEPEFLPGNQTTVSDFGEYASLAFRSILMIVVVLAVIILTLSGLQYITSEAGGGKGEAKSRALAAVIGLLIALSAYIILKQINPDLVEGSLNLEQLGSRIGGVRPPPTSGGGGGGGGGGGWGGGGSGGGSTAGPNRFDGPPGRYGNIPSNEFEVREYLNTNSNGNITINDSAECSENNTANCRTYVGGLNQNQIDGLLQLQESCNCSFVISGAAEQGGHRTNSNHYSGNAVDVRSDGSFIDTYLNNNNNTAGRDRLGIRYMTQHDAGSGLHWHIEFK